MSKSLYINKEGAIDLQKELQRQKGMLWVLGEIMKAAFNITEFKQLMEVMTDILMGVMGVTTCYIWINMEGTNAEHYTTFFRSNEIKNEFNEVNHSILPKGIKELKEVYVFDKDEIKGTLIHLIHVPSSRIVVPLKDFSEDSILGMVILEHKEENFFTSYTAVFLETLSVFIASKAQNYKLFQSVTEKSIKDPLTEAYNRGYLNEALNAMKGKYNDVTVAVIDTDNFKSINDELGHMEGDMVLKGIAQLAKGIVEEVSGEVIRYGGDEFIIIIPKGLAEAVHILEEFRRSVHYLKVAYDLATDVTVTLGICAYPEMIIDYSQILRVADHALLRGKAKGKNRIVLASDEDFEVVKRTLSHDITGVY